MYVHLKQQQQTSKIIQKLDDDRQSCIVQRCIHEYVFVYMALLYVLRHYFIQSSI